MKDPRQATGDTAGHVRVVAEVDGVEDGFGEVVMLRIDPEGGLEIITL